MHIAFFHVGMYICVCTCICVSIYICARRHGLKGTSSSEDQACVYTCVNAHIFVSLKYIHTYVYVHAYVYLYTYVPSNMDSKARAAARIRHAYVHV